MHDPTVKRGLVKKLSHHYLGPYKIAKQMSPVHFELEGMPDKKANLIHVNRMKLYPEPNKYSLRHYSPTKTPLPELNDHDNAEQSRITDNDNLIHDNEDSEIDNIPTKSPSPLTQTPSVKSSEDLNSTPPTTPSPPPPLV